MYVNCY